MSENENTTDAKAMPPASDGSVAQCRPIGAYVHTPTYDDLLAEVERLRLTAEEREVLGNVADDARYRALGWTEQVVRGLLDRLGGCAPQLDCGADRKSVASQRCRDTGGQPFDSAPTTTLTDEEREAVAWAARRLSDDPTLPRDRSTADTLRGLLEKHKGGER